MSKNGHSSMPQAIQPIEISLEPTPRVRLRTVGEVRRELAKLYVAARRNQIPTATATRLAYILVSLANMIRDSELEERIEALENESGKDP